MWIAFVGFSAITLGSVVEVKNAAQDVNAATRWTVSCSAMTMTLSSIVMIAHLIPPLSVLIVGTLLEGILLLVLTAFWSATVSIVTDKSNLLGVSEKDGGVMNGNLYFFSWAGFITAILLLVHYMKHALGVDVAEVRNRATRLTAWGGLLAASIVVMGSSARTLSEQCPYELQEGDNEDLAESFCSRAGFGVAVGTLSLTMTLLIVGMKLLVAAVPFFFEFGIAVFLAVLNGFGVAFITSPKGPGSAIGNLYFFSWISLFLAFMLSGDCFGELTGASNPMESDVVPSVENTSPYMDEEKPPVPDIPNGDPEL